MAAFAVQEMIPTQSWRQMSCRQTTPVAQPRVPHRARQTVDEAARALNATVARQEQRMAGSFTARGALVHVKLFVRLGLSDSASTVRDGEPGAKGNNPARRAHHTLL